MSANHLWRYQLPGTIEWRLKDKTPREADIGPAPGWSLLTPYAILRENFWDSGIQSVNRLPNGDLWITTSVITMRATGTTEPEREATPLSVAKTLQALRYLARQFALPERITAWSEPMSDPTLPVPPQEQDVGEMYLREYLLATAITEEHLDQLALLPPAFSPPASVLVMLDALLALIDQDFRKALLYGAIAVESLASTRLAEEYERVLAGAADERFRVVDIPVAGGGFARKDPIYLNLGEDSFSRMLHERPLYLLGRSLSVEDSATFTKALKLYKTRNKLAHVGEVPTGADTFELSEPGAHAGLHTAIDVLKWFGDTGRYVVGAKLVHVHDGTPLFDE